MTMGQVSPKLLIATIAVGVSGVVGFAVHDALQDESDRRDLANMGFHVVSEENEPPTVRIGNCIITMKKVHDEWVINTTKGDVVVKSIDDIENSPEQYELAHCF